jgi:hypothetical protein
MRRLLAHRDAAGTAALRQPIIACLIAVTTAVIAFSAGCLASRREQSIADLASRRGVEGGSTPLGQAQPAAATSCELQQADSMPREAGTPQGRGPARSGA